MNMNQTRMGRADGLVDIVASLPMFGLCGATRVGRTLRVSRAVAFGCPENPGSAGMPRPTLRPPPTHFLKRKP